MGAYNKMLPCFLHPCPVEFQQLEKQTIWKAILLFLGKKE